jgi:predicted PhzF superfamily epimerase YddE/YHI9
MTREIDIYQVDAFADRLFAGNPAAVCPLPDGWLPDELMQSIASENNLSETAFIIKSGEDHAIRWFTPTREVDLCGHATLASGYVLSSILEPGRDNMRFDSRSGPLGVAKDGEWFVLDFPTQPGRQVEDDGQIRAAIGQEPLEVWAAPKWFAVLPDEAAVLACRPDLDKIMKLGDNGMLLITAPGDECDFVSRYFAPGGGIPEDPVTGSAHSVLTPYWAERLGKTKLLARQVSQRGGLLKVELLGDRVLIAGQAVLYMCGKIAVS